MNRYFFVLNWTQLFVLMFIWFRIGPMLNSSLVTIGAFLGAMMTGGLASYTYNKKVKASDRTSFKARYFEKHYFIEVVVQMLAVLTLVLCSEFLWSGLWFLAGIFIMWLVNIVVECIWAKAHKY